MAPAVHPFAREARRVHDNAGLAEADIARATGGNYDLAGELRELDERNVELTDEQVQAAVADKQL